ncbi:hypothetical protein BU14_0451s0008 [Porphyra umbilicalis]|uniref:Uncharacterized protein n=1 Tax=Porphyra umbilicalis TaxID=2786 RepID=A0A1X6NUV1_PORUM|nr:hypothetical protein BU14_0451s0008 [Porphyra umbilicalis]|eukprot:OSX72280.1 hypothetical protein BU14_0451s0008 [Porphyra umbilicalis]
MDARGAPPNQPSTPPRPRPQPRVGVGNDVARVARADHTPTIRTPTTARRAQQHAPASQPQPRAPFSRNADHPTTTAARRSAPPRASPHPSPPPPPPPRTPPPPPHSSASSVTQISCRFNCSA